ncbi:Zn-dependent alcohol dehydrogenase [Xylophilus sp.]|uniref:Zn-dependent alcohol dehydrogenase n=1 Tax=Xylophilus sp. TaxID=2653893 RepID=UPI0013BBB214|nr:Zn-dependent alcohol dehydrogenase [Xylophilus sp.]KAF1050187.1 MAG: S-(hydroxymethyl)glutathione dehydrogenase [Xylophilus sp.]
MEFDAAVLRHIGEPLAIERVSAGDLQPGDVLVRIQASGLCHTDLEVMQGSLRYPLPIVLGHEGAGVVERIGSAVRHVAVGDHVVCSWKPHCGDCYYCDRAQPILCEPFKTHQPQGHLLDGTSRLSLNGRELFHFSVVSSHAQYCIVPESGAIRVPREMPFDRACLIGCGVMTGVGAVSRLARVEAGSSVAVIGCGAVGLNAIQAAALEEAAVVLAVDIDPKKLEMARVFGATHCVLAGEDPAGMAQSLTAGRGADYVFECAGGEPAMQLMYDLARPGGYTVMLGKVDVNKRVSLRFGSMMGEKTSIRSSYGGARPRRDFPWLCDLYLRGKLKLDELITLRLPLARINDGFEAMARGDVVRAVLMMEH